MISSENLGTALVNSHDLLYPVLSGMEKSKNMGVDVKSLDLARGDCTYYFTLDPEQQVQIPLQLMSLSQDTSMLVTRLRFSNSSGLLTCLISTP